MRFILLRLWPAFIPLLLYALWLYLRYRKAKKAGHPLPPVAMGPLFWVALASVALAVACFFYYGLSSEPTAGGTYIPPHVEGGKLIPGQIVPE